MSALLYLSDDVEITHRGGASALMAKRSGVELALEPGEALALELLGALGDAPLAAATADRALPGAGAWVDYVSQRYWSFLGGSAARPASFDWLGGAATARKRGRRNEAPHAIVWLVTMGCDRACPFCYYDVIPVRERRPPDATFSAEGLRRMLAEMRTIGASELYLTGGEPFLRPDLLEIMEEAERHRVRCHVVTRARLGRDAARRLAALTPGSVTVSLDAGTARHADALAGRMGYADEAAATLRALVDAGVDVEVNGVITAVNVGRLEDLVRRVHDLGVRRLSLSRLVPPVIGRTVAPALSPKVTDAEIDRRIADLRERWAPRLAIRQGDSGGVPTGGGTAPVCEVGYSELHVLPDGRATRCRYLPDETALHLGSLETLSIMEVWDGPSLAALNRPVAEAHLGTACAGCAQAEACDERGRCFASALALGGQLAGPDAFCVRR